MHQSSRRSLVLTILLASCLTEIAAAQATLMNPASLPRVAPGAPVTYGTSQTSLVTVSELEFAPGDSVTTYGDVAVGGMNLQRYETSGDTGFIAAVHLPGGALLKSIEFDLCDSSVIDAHWQAAVVSCAKLDGLCATLGTIMLSVSNSGGNSCAAYTQDLSGLNYVVDNTSNRIALLTLPGASDVTNSLVGAVIGYQLQVSPAPATADFGDVPTTHPFFQFVEALFHSGITAGCGSGNSVPIPRSREVRWPCSCPRRSACSSPRFRQPMSFESSRPGDDGPRSGRGGNAAASSRSRPEWSSAATSRGRRRRIDPQGVAKRN